MEYFIRELDFTCGDVQMYQATIGDVGHVVWDAAIALSKYIDTPHFTTTHNTMNDKLVVELGAGTGLVGLIAAKLGATVYATDLEELVPLIRKNIDENTCSMKGSIKGVALKWGAKGDVLGLHRTPDIILIADCVYYEESLHPLIETVRSLCGRDTVVYVSYEDRETDLKVELMKNFFELTRKYFDIKEVPLSAQDPQYSSEDIHILKMKLKTEFVS